MWAGLDGERAEEFHQNHALAGMASVVEGPSIQEVFVCFKALSGCIPCLRVTG